MAETRVAPGANPETVPAEPTKKSPVRTLILFAILLLVIGAYAHDYFVAAPAAREAHEKIQKLVDERNAQGVKGSELVTSDDIQAAINKKPSKVDKQKDHTVEVYRFWGGMLPQRQYISVLYLGEEPRRHHVHYLNSMPFEEDYPSETKIPEGPAESTGTDEGPMSGSSAAPGEGSDAPTSDSPSSDETPAPSETEAPSAAESSPSTTESPAETEAPAAEPSTEKSAADSE